jgi:hypothetical protein
MNKQKKREKNMRLSLQGVGPLTDKPKLRIFPLYQKKQKGRNKNHTFFLFFVS